MKQKSHSGIAGGLIVSIAGSIGFTVSYALGASTQWEGLSVLAIFGGLAFALIGWGSYELPHEEVTEFRDDYPSPAAERRAAEEAYAEGEVELKRRSFLVRLLVAAGAAAGAAALFPVRSLGPSTAAAVMHTKWKPGARVVGTDGSPIHRDAMSTGSIATVFPEGFVGEPSSQTILLRLPAGLIAASPDRQSWMPDGYVAFSKICTHAGCPVGLYRQQAQQLLCPCHQSVFDVLQLAKPIAGPAATPLPQLPLQLTPDGYLAARSDYLAPVGPAFWQGA